jgi:hypothetical protein
MAQPKKISANKGVKKAKQVGKKGKGAKGQQVDDKPQHLVAFLERMEQLYMQKGAVLQGRLADFIEESVECLEDLVEEYKEDPGRGGGSAEHRLFQSASDQGTSLFPSHVECLVPDSWEEGMDEEEHYDDDSDMDSD